MKRLLIFLVVVLTLTLPLSACGYSEAELIEARSAGYDEGYKAGYDEGQASAIAASEGSVINIYSEQYPGTTYDGCIKLRVYVTVMQVGDDGAFTVYVDVEPGDEGDFDPSIKSSKLYLKTGEICKLTFDFWVEGEWSYGAFCSP